MRHEHDEIIRAMAGAIDQDLTGMVFSDQVVEGLRAAAERGWVLAKIPERKNTGSSVDWFPRPYAEGWNDCLDAIEVIDLNDQ